MNKGITSVALYARVSSDRQAREQTIASQIADLEQRIAADGFTLEAEHRFIDEGYSGSTLIRPALEKLRDMAAAGAFQRLYVHCPDRLARAYAYQVLLVDELKRVGVELLFHNRQLSESPEDCLLLQVQGVVAEYERAKIMERARRGRLHAARQGSVTVVDSPPYGYRYVPRRPGEDACYQIYLPEAQVVRQMFHWVGAERLTTSQVKERLYQQGIVSPGGLPHWSRGQINRMLCNSTYRGEAFFGKTRRGPCKPRLRPQRGQSEVRTHLFTLYPVPRNQWFSIPVPALVEDALFESAQEQLQQNRRRVRERKAGSVTMLRGLLVCKQCGYAFGAGHASTSPYKYYRCTGTRRNAFSDSQPRCHTSALRMHQTDEAVWEDVMRLLEDPQRLAGEYERRLQGNRQDETSLTYQLEKMIQSQRRSISRLIDAYSGGLLEKEELEPRLQGARQRMEKLEKQLRQLQDQQHQQQELRLVVGQLESFAAMVKQNLHQADPQVRRQVVCALVKQVEVEENHLTIVYRVPEMTPPTDLDQEDLSHCRARRAGV